MAILHLKMPDIAYGIYTLSVTVCHDGIQYRHDNIQWCSVGKLCACADGGPTDGASVDCILFFFKSDRVHSIMH